MVKKSANKAPVMILFFNRPDNLKQVFDSVRKYRPKQLFLVQDGARNERLDDFDNVDKCRKIVENVDWDCDVYRNYSKENMGCDHREFTGIDWCFQYVDRLIILEDDCVPTQGFFRLCEECLEKYKDETSIHSIYGFNRVGSYECPYDYIFSKTSAGWGWATWKRVWDKVNELRNSDIFNNDIDVNYVNQIVEPSVKEIYGNFMKYSAKINKIEVEQSKIISWEIWVGLALIFNNMLTIVPKKNMIHYVGISDNATHTTDDPRLLPHKIRKVLTQNAYETGGIVSHPPYIVRDTKFEKLSNKSMSCVPIFAKSEHIMRVLRYKGLKELFVLLAKRIRK